MKLKQYPKKRRASQLIATTCIVALFSCSTAFAGNNGRWPQNPPGPNNYMQQLPQGHSVIKYHGQEYMYHQGHYYQRGPKGFRSITPPHGVMIRHLPPGVETLLIAGMTYFLFAGVYYQKAPQGYIVVEKPAAPPQPAMMAGQFIIVDAHTLNVRSGPGINHPVTSQVTRGMQLEIKGTAPGWYYVRLPNGAMGWVMERYTQPLRQPAQG
ncbi:SH3 domain-containing protein [Desulfogranum japonicum]|uniref:SH3 domain-containing protein n=1 Tax=Desulfogranum japonicum TaxID=231447 RepID=UPI000413126F|nr:SH3 domain-containing protein [Desulfogranum japonicum]